MKLGAAQLTNLRHLAVSAAENSEVVIDESSYDKDLRSFRFAYLPREGGFGEGDAQENGWVYFEMDETGFSETIKPGELD